MVPPTCLALRGEVYKIFKNRCFNTVYYEAGVPTAFSARSEAIVTQPTADATTVPASAGHQRSIGGGHDDDADSYTDEYALYDCNGMGKSEREVFLPAAKEEESDSNAIFRVAYTTDELFSSSSYSPTTIDTDSDDETEEDQQVVCTSSQSIAMPEEDMHMIINTINTKLSSAMHTSLVPRSSLEDYFDLLISDSKYIYCIIQNFKSLGNFLNKFSKLDMS
jgi:hypothetical protein